MSAPAVGTIIVTTFLVSGAAVWLIWVSISLQQVAVGLDTIIEATTGITDKLAPAPGAVASISRDVGAIQSALHGLISLATGGGGGGMAPGPRPGPARAAAPEPEPYDAPPASATRAGARRY